jgi:rhodanese-related sulfurtransferase
MSVIILMKDISHTRHKAMSRKRKTSKPRSTVSIVNRRHKAQKKNLPWRWIGLGIVAVALLVAVILLRPKTTHSNEITVAQAYDKFQQGAFILDVRTQAEWDQAHIANSILIPLEQLQNRITEVPRDRDIVVVCRTGVRSRTGMNILQDAGYTRAVCMTGGLTAWKAAGYPLESSFPSSIPSQWMVASHDQEAHRLGVTRQSIIKIPKLPPSGDCERDLHHG